MVKSIETIRRQITDGIGALKVDSVKYGTLKNIPTRLRILVVLF